jgi:hypothetical protein
MDQPMPISEEEQRLLDDLAVAIAQKRDDAVTARKESGIEEVWRKAEEAYIGIDDANRHEYQNARWAKPTSMEGPVTTESSRSDNTKSTLYVPLTARYVDAGAAKLSEILLPTDDKPFSIEPTPRPELVKAKEILRAAMKDVMRNGGDAPAPTPVVAQQPTPMVPGGAMAPMPMGPMAASVQGAVPSIDQAKAVVDQALSKAKAAEKRIHDWLVECNYRGSMRKIIFDSSRMGVGVIKAPYAEEQKSFAMTRTDDGVGIEIIRKIQPAAKWIDPWNVFPDQTCGEDIQDGDYVFERDYLSPKAVSKLKGRPGYIDSQIDKVLKEGPGKVNQDESNPNQTKKNDKRFEVWYFYGIVKRADMQAARARGVELKTDDGIHAIVTMINDTVIRAVINPLDTGEFPYRAFSWRRRPGHWAGVGVGEQVDVAQRIVNGATRAMMNNAGLSSGLQIVIDSLAITPADTKWTITPNKMWFKAPDANWDDVRKVFMAVEFPDRNQALMAIVEYGFRLAEESTNIPLVTQGMSGTTTPDTFGAAQLQNNNANQLLRDIGYRVDDCITEPVIRNYYEWLLLDPDVPDNEKGDWQINAHGSSALVERAIQDQTIQQMGGMVLNPVFGVDPKKWFAEFMKTKRLDPRTVQYAEGEQQPQSAPPYQVQVAQINAQSRKDTAVIDAQAQGATDKSVATSRHEEIMARRELAMLQYANTNQMKLTDVKAQLAQTGMKLRTQKELAAFGGQARQVVTPPTEPPGRAQPGMAYQQ